VVGAYYPYHGIRSRAAESTISITAKLSDGP
jgi:hypothetical protein